MVADAVARAHRLHGRRCVLPDRHRRARPEGRAGRAEGRAEAERSSPIGWRRSSATCCPRLNIANDDFIRTTEPRHHAASQELWRRVRDRGFIYKGKYEGWYCTVDEVFVPDTQLQDGRCPICGNAVERIAEESYFFKLSAFQDRLLEHYRGNPEFVVPAIRRNEMMAFLEGGLEDLSVSRTSFKWGIPVPDDPAHVMYVWFDALTNYMTAVGFGSDPEPRFDEALAGRRAPDRQGDRPPARDLLAGVPHGRRPAAPEADRQPRLVDDGRRQDVEVEGERRAAAGLHRPLRPRRPSLLRVPRDGLRPGRQFRRRRLPHAVQRRSRQRSRQPGQPRDDDDSPVLRRDRARAPMRRSRSANRSRCSGCPSTP